MRIFELARSNRIPGREGKDSIRRRVEKRDVGVGWERQERKVNLPWSPRRGHNGEFEGGFFPQVAIGIFGGSEFSVPRLPSLPFSHFPQGDACASHFTKSQRRMSPYLNEKHYEKI